MANYNNNGGSSGPVEFKLVERLGVLDTHKSGWAREVNLVAWNGSQPKFDIRDWDPDHERMSKGITLHEREAIKLAKILVARLQDGEPVRQSVSAGIDVSSASYESEEPASEALGS